MILGWRAEAALTPGYFISRFQREDDALPHGRATAVSLDQSPAMLRTLTLSHGERDMPALPYISSAKHVAWLTYRL